VENFASGGKVASDVHYSNWLATAASPGTSNATAATEPVSGGMMYSRQISISRPSDDYQLQIEIKKLTINETISSERFVLAQPSGTKLIHPDENTTEAPKP
jgi:outer membrane lipoprotein-sorting protein